MKVKKCLSTVFTVVLIFVVFTGCGNKINTNDSGSSTTVEDTTEDTVNKTVALIAGGSEGFWEGVKKGGENAAKEFDYEVDFYGYSGEIEVAVQKNDIKSAILKNVAGVVFAPLGDDYSDVLSLAYDKKIPVVQLHTEINIKDKEELQAVSKDSLVSAVLSTDEEAGALAAEKLFDVIKEDIKKSENKYTIGVILSDNGSVKVNRANGFIEKFKELADADKELKGKYSLKYEVSDDYTKAFEMLYKQGVKAVFMTEENIGGEIADYVFADKEKFKDLVFCGFDSGTKQIQWLKSTEGPEFIGGVAQNYSDLGYNAVRQCIIADEGGETKSDIEIGVEWYDNENVDKLLQDGIVYNG